MEKILGSEAIVRALIAEGVDTIFGYPGGAIMPMYDALYDYRDRIRHVLVRHEQGAAHAAEGYARMAHKPGVCVVTSGPGATNLVTGIADAMMDSVPLVCITGQVARSVLGTDAFQETDVVGVTMPITKWNYQIFRADEIPCIMAKAFYIARSGRPGPVVLDITKNAQFEKCEFNYQRLESLPSYKIRTEPDPEEIAAAAELINSASKPYLLVGHGVLISRAEQELRELVERTGIPVGSTLLGLSALPSTHPLFTGMLGMHGNYGPNVLSNEADLIIAVGMRFDDRVTSDTSRYVTKAKVIHIDIDPAEIGKNVRTTVAVHGDAKAVLRALLPVVEKREHTAWVAEFKKCYQLEHEKVIAKALRPDVKQIHMVEVVDLVSRKTRGEAVIVSDVGQQQMMTARYYQFNRLDSWISSGGLGTMGFGLPAAMGAKLAVPDRPVIAFIGDGGFQMTIQELATIAQEQIPVKALIMNNGYLGMVRQWQEMFFQKRYSFTPLKNPDFVKICEGFGIEAARVSERAQLEAAVDRLLAAPNAFVLEVMVAKEENVFPMVPPGASVSEIKLE